MPKAVYISLKNRINPNPTIDQIKQAITYAWEFARFKMEWPDMEDLLVYILNSCLSDSEKIGLTMECIDAYTKRGHFQRNAYPKGYNDTRNLL